MEITKGLVLFAAFMIGIITTGAAGAIIVMSGSMNSTFMMWFALVYCLSNATSWYMLGMKLSQYDKEESNDV
jgi:predicted permease